MLLSSTFLTKGPGASEAAAAYQYNFPAACQQPAHFIVFILEDTFPGRFEPAAKTAYTGLYRTIVTNFNYIFILYCGHCSGGQVVNNQPLLVLSQFFFHADTFRPLR